MMEGQKKLKIVADAAIPFLEGVLEPWAEVLYKEGSEIGRDDVKDADALVLRTRTRCDAELLEGSSVKMIASATIGVDHIDIPWCEGNGIVVRNAAGCNAGGVMEYVFSAIYAVAARQAIDLSGKTIGIVGVGHVGKRVEAMARALGFRVLKNDPPREKAEGAFEFCSLQHLLRHSDIVTMHVPLDGTTRGMADRGFFSSMQDGAFFINAARGEIVDDAALKETVRRLGPVVIDTWNNEPDVDAELVSMTAIATPHIAGYSYQGKQNGTAAAVRAIARYFGIPQLTDFFPKTDVPELEAVKIDVRDKSQGEIAAIFQYNYPIFADDFLFRTHISDFERLRREYSYRREVYVE